VGIILTGEPDGIKGLGIWGRWTRGWGVAVDDSIVEGAIARVASPGRLERAAWLAWSQVAGVGPVLLQRLADRFGSLGAAWGAAAADLLAVERFGRRALDGLAAARSRGHILDSLAAYEANNPAFWTPHELAYPSLLREIPDPPPLLHYRGAVVPEELTGGRSLVAIVGTRSPSEYGRRWARRLATTLAQQGFVIVSGLAKGIDAEAHWGAIAAGGRTIAVLGTGVNILYPLENRDLYRTIIGTDDSPAHGLALSEYASGTAPNSRHFPQRNRIIAGLCRATIVIEGGVKSGAIITARLAMEQGREVFALPGTLDNPMAEGCLRLLASGAQPVLGEADLLTALGRLPQLDGGPGTRVQADADARARADAGANSNSNSKIDLDPALGGRSPEPPATQATKSPEKALENNFARVAIAAPPIPPVVAVPDRLRPIHDAIAPTEITSFETIAIATNWATQDITVALLELELLGAIAQLPGMLYRRC
jgi:DNA processing protein